MDERVANLPNENKSQQAWTISMHTFCDLSHVSPLVFLYLLQECYAYGTCRASYKFRVLNQQVYQALHNDPQHGPAIFTAWCLYVLPVFESYCEGFSHLILSALNRFLKTGTTKKDIEEAQHLAAKLFVYFVRGRQMHDERIIVKILKVFGVSFTNIENVLHDFDQKSDNTSGRAEKLIEQYIDNLVERHSYTNAVLIIEHFSIHHFEKAFLCRIMGNDSEAAEKWANFMGRPMLNLLVQEYVDRKQLDYACKIVKKYNLQEEFPEVWHLHNERLLKKFAEKGLWDIAEERTKKDKQLIEYLVYLAIEAGYTEKVEELCQRYSLEGFMDVLASGTTVVHKHYLSLEDLSVEDIVFVDEVVGLNDATCHIEGGKILGIDCEWKPNYEKGQQNKVSIMQIASGNKAYIFDLIKLYDDVPEALDDCLTRIFQSPSLLKLGYNFKCDMNQLAHGYSKLKCFSHFEKVLDIENVFKQRSGGLSGLAEKILGAPLNKVRRNSNWEQRPLTQQQLEYAALDAVVLVHIFRHVPDHTQAAGVSDGHKNIKWKSHIV